MFLTSRGRQSDKEFGREITHQGACLLRRASNQLRNNNCVTKINSAFAASHQAGLAHGAPQAAEPKPVLRGPGRRVGGTGKESLATLLSPLLSAPPCPPSWPPQRWSRVRVHPKEQTRCVLESSAPPTNTLLWADQRPWPTVLAGLRRGRRNAGVMLPLSGESEMAQALGNV